MPIDEPSQDDDDRHQRERRERDPEQARGLGEERSAEEESQHARSRDGQLQDSVRARQRRVFIRPARRALFDLHEDKRERAQDKREVDELAPLVREIAAQLCRLCAERCLALRDEIARGGGTDIGAPDRRAVLHPQPRDGCGLRSFDRAHGVQRALCLLSDAALQAQDRGAPLLQGGLALANELQHRLDALRHFSGRI